jgi:hypothetical protein
MFSLPFAVKASIVTPENAFAIRFMILSGFRRHEAYPCTVNGGHARGTSTAGYVHLDVALVTAADRVSAVIAAALDEGPTAQVVPLHRHVSPRA